MQQNYTLTARFVKQERTDGVLSTDTTEKCVELKLESFEHGDMMKLQQIMDFRNGANTILSTAKEALEDGKFVEVALSVSAYEHVAPYSDGATELSLEQLTFDSWSFSGYGDDAILDPEEGGLHLLPDPKYTNKCQDIYVLWSQDFMTALANAGL